MITCAVHPTATGDTHVWSSTCSPAMPAAPTPVDVREYADALNMISLRILSNARAAMHGTPAVLHSCPRCGFEVRTPRRRRWWWSQ